MYILFSGNIMAFCKWFCAIYHIELGVNWQDYVNVDKSKKNYIFLLTNPYPCDIIYKSLDRAANLIFEK